MAKCSAGTATGFAGLYLGYNLGHARDELG